MSDEYKFESCWEKPVEVAEASLLITKKPVD